MYFKTYRGNFEFKTAESDVITIHADGIELEDTIEACRDAAVEDLCRMQEKGVIFTEEESLEFIDKATTFYDAFRIEWKDD